MENNFPCEFCGGTFNTSASLKKHMKTAKYCISIQENGENYSKDSESASIRVNIDTNIGIDTNVDDVIDTNVDDVICTVDDYKIKIKELTLEVERLKQEVDYLTNSSSNKSGSVKKERILKNNLRNISAQDIECLSQNYINNFIEDNYALKCSSCTNSLIAFFMKMLSVVSTYDYENYKHLGTHYNTSSQNFIFEGSTNFAYKLINKTPLIWEKINYTIFFDNIFNVLYYINVDHLKLLYNECQENDLKYFEKEKK
jgi:hypothetical protein